MIQIAGHELVGHRAAGRVGQLPADELVVLWTRITTTIVKHGFVIEYRDLEPPRTGIFDGLRIVIDPDVGFEMQCFVLLHLFGHSVQWVAPSIEHKLDALQHTADKARFMQVLHDYEYEAAHYALTLLHEAGVTQLDQWFADFVATDWRYVERYYQTDQIPPWHECLQCGCPPVAAWPIPPLVHRQVEVRFAF
ncbi:MAG: hypothetical protein K2Y37_04930 [Pirellulales bacterium]|nr:hypothetical protein [Pirellulales bacterium]